jgi:hypothetical protein
MSAILAPLHRPEGGWLVTRDRVDITFRDGSRAQMHTVLRHGQPERFLRAVPHATGEHVVDVRHLSPDLADDLCAADPYDVPYLLATTFKLQFRSLDAFMTAVRVHCEQPSEASA